VRLLADVGLHDGIWVAQAAAISALASYNAQSVMLHVFMVPSTVACCCQVVHDYRKLLSLEWCI